MMMPKAQVKFLVGYCILMLLFTQLLQHSHRYHAFLEPLTFLNDGFRLDARCTTELSIS